MKIILASKSGVRKKILDNNDIDCEVIVSNIDEDEVKASLLAEGADPLSISKNLAEVKSIKISSRHPNKLVLGADSVIALNNQLINKPRSVFRTIGSRYRNSDAKSISVMILA